MTPGSKLRVTGKAHDHEVEQVCEKGLNLYTRALRQGRIPADEADEIPCPLVLGLLNPAPDDRNLLEPVAPGVALHRLLRASADRIAEERRREERLTETFASLARREGVPDMPSSASAMKVLEGVEGINRALTDAMADASRELLCVQPNLHYTDARGRRAQPRALARDQALLDRGGRIRALYQHTQRHLPLIHSRYERLRGDVEARSLDEVTDRLIVVDRAVAFMPADKEATRALEIRQPTVVGFLVTVFDRLWRLATPMYPEAAPQPSVNGVTPRQHAIAALLVEGHTDAVIAERLGMNIRTAREHIAKLAATLGSGSRAQLGYLIARSGILVREE
ncbi:helix-turn-helix transcriptional regulator [Streptomyces sp. GD-15H]|uniref:helix-turn-helix transcriptional regulator n=1 Tax=Streptomyces sp. GD-15H TaxID=3129112 RepID=UPI0032508BC5